MNNIPYIRQEPVARKYTISFDTKSCAFHIVFKKKDLEHIRTYSRIQELISKEEKLLHFKKSWNLSGNYHFGFNQVMKTSFRDEKVTVSAKVTKDNSFAIAKTFAFFLRLLSIYPVESRRPENGEEEQEMIIETSCSNSFRLYGAAMTADISLNFSHWIVRQADQSRALINDKVNKAMNSLYVLFYKQNPSIGGLNGLLPYGFLFQPPHGIYTCQFGVDGENQKRLQENPDSFSPQTYCHNLDSHQDQLILLAGFVKICEAFRESHT